MRMGNRQVFWQLFRLQQDSDGRFDFVLRYSTTSLTSRQIIKVVDVHWNPRRFTISINSKEIVVGFWQKTVHIASTVAIAARFRADDPYINIAADVLFSYTRKFNIINCNASGKTTDHTLRNPTLSHYWPIWRQWSYTISVPSRCMPVVSSSWSFCRDCGLVGIVVVALSHKLSPCNREGRQPALALYTL